MKNLTRNLTLFLAGAGLALTAVTVLRVNATKPMPPVPIPPPAKPFANSLGATGLIEARRENVQVGAPGPGLVEKVNVAVWGRVTEGDVLFEMDTSELAAQRVSASADIVVRESELAQAQNQLARLRRLHSSRAISDQDFEDAENAEGIAAARLAAARAEVERIDALKNRLLVRAPGEGTVLQVSIRAGEYVNPTDTDPPMILGDIDELQVRANVDEQVAPRIRPGMNAVGFLKGDATDPIPMEFVRIEPFVIPKQSLTGSSAERVDTRVLQIIYKFANPKDRTFYVGQQIDLFLQTQPWTQTQARP